jgi:hypothetical protein
MLGSSIAYYSHVLCDLYDAYVSVDDRLAETVISPTTNAWQQPLWAKSGRMEIINLLSVGARQFNVGGFFCFFRRNYSYIGA